MNIIKYFYEEPALLEPRTPDEDPDARRWGDRPGPGSGRPRMDLETLLDTDDYYRGYLAGTALDADRVGLTALDRPAAFVEPMVEALGAAWWGRCPAEAEQDAAAVEALDEDAARRVLRDPSGTALLVAAPAAPDADAVAAVATTARRHTPAPLRALLDAAAEAVVFFPESAHDGHDWSFFAARPMRDALVDAFRHHPTDDVRRFVLPYQKARSESKFYFETWQLTESPLPAYVEEV